MDGVVYDLCIVGAGLIGSAAARHATIISPAAKICLIGPKEPKTVEEKHGRTIFGAHYDEGRITRTLDPNPIWGVLANRSIARYRDIEKRTGVKFFSEVGHMTICNKENEDVIRMKEIATDLHVNFDIMDHKDVNKQFTYLNIDTYDVALLQSKGAGHVSPRSQLLAQQTAAHLQGCNIIDDVIVHVTETNQLNGSVMKLTTEKGDILYARKVLLATGGFTSFRRLLPPGKELDVQLKSQTVAFAEVTPKDAARLKDMPCVIRKMTQGGKYNLYMLPPIKYPDGKYYLKIGHGEQFETEFTTEKEVADWFRTEGLKSAHKPLLDMMFDIVKGVRPVRTFGDACVTTHTPSHLVYCDMVTPLLGVAVGGNGHAAKSADEIGKMAARMVIAGKWDHDLPADKFTVKFKNNATSKL